MQNFIKALLPALFSLHLFVNFSLYAQSPAEAGSAINLQNVEIGIAANAFSKFTGKSYLVDEGINRKMTLVVPVSTSPEMMSEIFTAALTNLGLHLYPVGENLWKISGTSAFFQPPPMPRERAEWPKSAPAASPDFSGIEISGPDKISLTAKAVRSIMSAYLAGSPALNGDGLVYVSPPPGNSSKGYFKVVCHKPEGIFQKLGFKEGDIVISVAGGNLSERSSMAQRAIAGLLEDLSINGQSQVEITRDGKSLLLNYTAPKSASDPAGYGITPRPVPTATPADLKPIFINREVASSLIDSSLADFTIAEKNARVVPYFKNGKNEGLRIFALRKESPFTEMGFNNGDIIKSIDGIVPQSFQDIDQIPLRLRQKGMVSVIVLRDFKLVTLLLKMR